MKTSTDRVYTRLRDAFERLGSRSAVGVRAENLTIVRFHQWDDALNDDLDCVYCAGRVAVCDVERCDQASRGLLGPNAFMAAKILEPGRKRIWYCLPRGGGVIRRLPTLRLPNWVRWYESGVLRAVLCPGAEGRLEPTTKDVRVDVETAVCM